MDRSEAIEIVRKHLPDGRHQLSEALETLIPELKESEDERIRKEIVYYLKNFIPHRDDNLVAKSKLWIAWLEKQDSQNLANSAKTCKDEQNPAWSVLDFRTWRYIVSDVLTKKDGIGQYIDSAECKNIAKYMQEEWSKKLSIKQNSAWSQEDEHRITDTIYFLDTAKKHYASTEELDACIEWLKSLKERCTWKPSEEQMDALQYVSNFDYGGHKATLVSLYEQLKKLNR